MKTAEQAANNEIVISRRYALPPERVYAAWTTAETIRQWWGPRGSRRRSRR